MYNAKTDFYKVAFNWQLIFLKNKSFLSPKNIAYIIGGMKNNNKRTKGHKNIRAKLNIIKFSLCLCGFVPLCMIFISGCQENQTNSVTNVQKAFPENSETTWTMQIAEEVLDQLYFEIEKADTNKGYIRTRPLSGAQFFEFWRNDNVGLENELLSNLHSIRRIVELTIDTKQNTLNIDCKVRVQRLSIPPRKLTSSSQAYAKFTKSNVLLQRLELNPEQKANMAWLDLDNDKELEAEILKRISSMITKKSREMLNISSSGRNNS